jgi:hypothetical protein
LQRQNAEHVGGYYFSGCHQARVLLTVMRISVRTTGRRL